MLDAALDRAPDTLDAGLAVARGSRGVSFVVLPAPIVAPAAVVAAFRAAPVVAWASRELAIVGVGVARELRGRGPARFDDVVAQARALELGAMSGSRWTPRVLGGAAWAPGTADAAPWTGFGDAWFALPRDKTFGNTGLYTSGPVATPAGRAYQAVAAHASRPGG